MRPEYTAEFVENPGAILDRLMTLDWLQEKSARMEYFMSDVPRVYTYGKGKWATQYDSRDYSPEVLSIQEKLNSAGLAYNVCFLNRYDEKGHALGWHADDSPEMDTNHPIAVISFGAEREIWWRPNEFSGVIPKENRQLLGNGSLFVMPARFQEFFQHRIPRCDRACGVRISLTFRRYV